MQDATINSSTLFNGQSDDEAEISPQLLPENRVEGNLTVEELMQIHSIDQTNNLSEVMVVMGLGRKIIAFIENE